MQIMAWQKIIWLDHQQCNQSNPPRPRSSQQQTIKLIRQPGNCITTRSSKTNFLVLEIAKYRPEPRRISSLLLTHPKLQLIGHNACWRIMSILVWHNTGMATIWHFSCAAAKEDKHKESHNTGIKEEGIDIEETTPPKTPKKKAAKTSPTKVLEEILTNN